MQQIRFPSDADVVAEEAAYYRSLSPDERFAYFQGILAMGDWMIKQSPNADLLRKQNEEQEQLAMQAVKDFIARHAR
jgi:hypothetical protein